VRIGTKIPTVLPQRITKDLVKMLKKHHPLWVSPALHASQGADARE
jgi:lysine 2,3-aminomutase